MKAVILLCVLAACVGGRQSRPQAESPHTMPSVLWFADHESGNLTQWYSPDVCKCSHNGGYDAETGSASASASTDVAHGGKWSAKLVINTPSSPTSGARLFRWKESDDPSYLASGLYYSAWFYFPVRYTVSGRFWNIFQFKSIHPDPRNPGQKASDPIWYLDVQNRPGTGAMFVTLVWWNQLTIEGPHAGEHGFERYTQTAVDLPVGRWVNLRAYLRQAGQFTGRLTVWQDGVQLFDMQNVVTRYADGDDQWSVNNYSDSLDPTPATVYIDDAQISTN